MVRPERLTQRFVDSIKSPGRYSDGAGAFGLSLLVRITRAGGLSKTYQQRVRVNDRPNNVGLGSAATVKLAEARAKAMQNSLRIQAARRPTGLDRLLGNQGGGAVDVTPAESTAPTVAALWEDYLQLKSASWKPGSKTESGERSRFSAYVLPTLAAEPINEVSRADLVDVLSPVWHTRPEVAGKLKRALSGLLDFAVGRDHIAANPMQYAVLALGRQRNGTKHHGALRWQDAPAALAYVRASKTYHSKKLALELLMLTAVRSGEVRGARWHELAEGGSTWTIPAERMKGGREHRIPLSPAAQDVLRQAYDLSGGLPDSLIFPTKKGGAISDDGLRQLLVRRFPGTTAHGLRSTFRDWAAEQTEYPAEIAEHALAHLEGSATVRAYLRTDYFEKRRALMEAWADFLNSAS